MQQGVGKGGAARKRSRLGYILKAVTRAGFDVSAVEETSEGGFRVLISGVGSSGDLPNEWDEVLIDGAN